MFRSVCNEHTNLIGARKLAPRGRGRPKAENVAALTNHVVLVAREVFFELGLGTATMELIAQRARISKETLYARFKDKNLLFEAVMQASVDAWAEGATNNPVIVTLNLEEELRHHVEVQIRAHLSPDFADLARIIFAERRSFPELGQTLFEKVSFERVTQLANKMREYAEIDGIPCHDADSAAETLRGLVSGLLQVVTVSGRKIGQKEQGLLVDRILEIFLASRHAW